MIDHHDEPTKEIEQNNQQHFKNTNYDKNNNIDAADATNSIIEPTQKRYLILVLFCLHSMINGAQWIYLSSITSTLTDFYGVDSISVNWTSMVYMAAYIPLAVPASWLFDRIGMRTFVLIGSFGTSFGSLIKCFSCQPDRFALLMTGQIIVACSQLFVLSVPPRLASVWFPDHQVALANACGVFGNQLGIALGFVVPQLVLGSSALISNDVNNNNTTSQVQQQQQQIQQGLVYLFLGVAVFSALVSLLLMVLFDEAPAKPPGLARLRQIKQEAAALSSAVAPSPESDAGMLRPSIQQLSTGEKSTNTFGGLLRALLTDRSFVMLIIGYGLLVGVFYAISTALNQMLELKRADAALLAGRLGLVMVVAGMFGSVLAGYTLDKTHRYKLINSGLYLASLLAMFGFALAVELNQTLVYYIAIVLLGFFMTGYLLIGFEMSNEITWPLPESLSAGLLNLAAQVFGVALTYAGCSIVDKYGSAPANVFFITSLVVGFVVTSTIKAQMKRQQAIEL